MELRYAPCAEPGTCNRRIRIRVTAITGFSLQIFNGLDKMQVWHDVP